VKGTAGERIYTEGERKCVTLVWNKLDGHLMGIILVLLDRYLKYNSLVTHLGWSRCFQDVKVPSFHYFNIG